MERVSESEFQDDVAYLGTWSGEGFRLRLFDDGRRDQMGKSLLRYSFADLEHDPGELFQGDDYGVSPMHAVDSPEAAAGLLSFLSLEEGDTDAEYFAGYTPAQRAWLETGRAQELKLAVFELEEQALRPELADVEVEPGPLARPSSLSDAHSLDR